MNLREEMQQAVSDVGQRHIDVLLGHGVPPAELASLGARQEPFGVALIKTNPEGIYWPCDTGSPRLIIPCYERGDIVDLVGYSDSGHFSRTFKKLTGLSANEYRSRLS